MTGSCQVNDRNASSGPREHGLPGPTEPPSFIPQVPGERAARSPRRLSFPAVGTSATVIGPADREPRSCPPLRVRSTTHWPVTLATASHLPHRRRPAEHGLVPLGDLVRRQPDARTSTILAAAVWASRCAARTAAPAAACYVLPLARQSPGLVVTSDRAPLVIVTQKSLPR